MEDQKVLEENHLTLTLNCLKTEIDSVENKMKDYEFMAKKLTKYIAENPNLDASEISATILEADESVGKTFELIEKKTKLERLYNKPYFAKIKFVCEDDDKEDFYIGIKGIWDKNGIYAVDWRAPIGAVYYDGNIGKCSYTAPGGVIEGELKYKRQINIENGKIEYFFDSAISIDDDILQKALSKNTSNVMTNIVQTIQKEQNQVIRESKDTNIVLDGVAGSGKTSIGMHRIAYLLFAYKGSLKNENILIISPNQLFTKYISSILPELGEDNVKTTDLVTILKMFLPLETYDFLSRHELVEDVLSGNDKRQKEASFKYSKEYFEKLKKFLSEKNNPEKLTNITLLGKKISPEDIKKFYYHPFDYNIHNSIDFTATRLVGQFAYNKTANQQANLKNQLAEQILKKLINPNLDQLVEEFFFKNHLSTSHIDGKTIRSEDLSTYAFLSIFTKGFETNRIIKQIFIDELQDYDCTSLMILKELYVSSTFTMVGDYNQNLLFNLTNKDVLLENYENSKLFKLENSYRSTINITQFSARILGKTFNTTFVRNGEDPKIVECKDEDEKIEKIKETIDEYIKDGFKRIAIVCKNNEECVRYKKHFENFAVVTSENQNIIDENKLIVSVLLSKGLEFDCVIIPDASQENYSKEREKQVLYVASTRALHRLSLFYTGKLTEFVK